MERKEKLKIQTNKLRQIREDLGMNRTQFSHYVDIPLRTLEEWEAGRRQMPDYVLRLLTYYTKMERLLEEQKITLAEETNAEE
ncbi:MAG: helix-turn-helix domain-containing protein [Lachnospiraceae bacterium]|nr:helix-turn-helix domain-containing protein [Lachnospiraceae bacterium]